MLAHGRKYKQIYLGNYDEFQRYETFTGMEAVSDSKQFPTS